MSKPHTKKGKHAAAVAAAACVTLWCAGCVNQAHHSSAEDEWTSHVVTGDIQAGIKAHIDEQIRLGNGYFNLDVHGTNEQLRLVKIHTEYLATLGPHEHFACVDLVDTNGDVHDVDFFMHGDAGSMKVTRTLPHKFNGKPYYFWQETEDHRWVTVPADEASQELMGVIIPRDEFEFRYKLTLPDISGPTRLWVPQPKSDAFQRVALRSIDEPRTHRVLADENHGNEAFYWELGPEDSGKDIDIIYRVERKEKAAYEDDSVDPKVYLGAERMVPNAPRFEAIARAAVAGKATDLQKARALYDLVIDEVRYAKAGEGWGQGDAQFACDARHGNCTDFHSYFMALARAIGIPARFAIGAAIPSNRDEGGVDGYHCWVEFHAEEKWWPVDISEADKYSALSTYYFGHHPANRIEFSRGRDLDFDPGPSAGPINFFAYPVLEVEGVQVTTPVVFSFRRQS